MGITKQELADQVSDKMGTLKNVSAQIVDGFFDIIKGELIAGKDFMITGFGKWSIKNKRARIGRNPQTGKTMTISARKVITFKYSNKLWEKLNG